MEQEMTLEELFQFMEEHEGEFFIRVCQLQESYLRLLPATS